MINEKELFDAIMRKANDDRKKEREEKDLRHKELLENLQKIRAKRADIVALSNVVGPLYNEGYVEIDCFREDKSGLFSSAINHNLGFNFWTEPEMFCFGICGGGCSGASLFYHWDDDIFSCSEDPNSGIRGKAEDFAEACSMHKEICEKAKRIVNEFESYEKKVTDFVKKTVGIKNDQEGIIKMSIPKLTDEQISKAKELWNSMNKAMEENGIRLCYDYDCGSMVVVPMELKPCDDHNIMISEDEHSELMSRGSLSQCENYCPWFCVSGGYSFSAMYR